MYLCICSSTVLSIWKWLQTFKRHYHGYFLGVCIKSYNLIMESRYFLLTYYGSLGGLNESNFCWFVVFSRCTNVYRNIFSWQNTVNCFSRIFCILDSTCLFLIFKYSFCDIFQISNLNLVLIQTFFDCKEIYKGKSYKNNLMFPFRRFTFSNDLQLIYINL